MNNIEYNFSDENHSLSSGKGEFHFYGENGNSFEDKITQREKLEKIFQSKSLLPIGSVITMDDTDVKYMIVGYNYKGFDYSLCKYPEGISNALIGLNHDCIVRIYNVGYIDSSSNTFRAGLIQKK